MENLLISYLEGRLKEEGAHKQPGPVITISREYGCPSKILAGILADRLRAADPEAAQQGYGWRWIGREILEESARDLHVDPKHINHIFDYHERTIIDDILASTRKDGSYKSDTAIRKSMAKVIRSMSEQGNVIIIGRAGVAINRSIQKSLHIRLVAPLEWRVAQIMALQGLSKEQSLELIMVKDANRKRFLEYYLGHKFQIQIFDLIYNCAFLRLEEIADSIVFSARQRHLI